MRRLKMTARTTGSLLFVLICAASPAAVRAQVRGERKGGPPVASGRVGPAVEGVCGASDKVEAVGVSVSPEEASANQAVTVKLTIKNNCPTGTLNVPWELSKDRQVIATGTKEVAAGSAAEVTHAWTAAAGDHNFHGRVNMNDEITESEKGNNATDAASLHVNVAWGGVLGPAKEAAQTAVREWIAAAEVMGGEVNGPVLTLKKGALRSSVPLKGRLSSAMTAKGIPEAAANAFASAVSAQLDAWAGGYETVIPTAYVNYTCAYNPVPPAVTTPYPLKLGSSSGDSALSEKELGKAIRAQLGPLAEESGADSAVDDFAEWFEKRFTAWRDLAMLSNIHGQGKAPAAAPFCGPVQGQANGKYVLVGPVLF